MENSYTTDLFYKGGSYRSATNVTDTFQKQMPPRAAAQEARVQTVTIKLSKKAIAELKSDAPAKFAQLIKLLDEVHRRPPLTINVPQGTPPPSPPPTPPATKTIRIPRDRIQAILNGNKTQKQKAIEKIVEQVVDKRVTRSQSAAVQPRRSARLNP